MAVVALLGLLLGSINAVGLWIKAAKYRRKALGFSRLEQRSQAIERMDPATRTREADDAMDDPFLSNPEWNRKMIPYLRSLKEKYRRAAERPWFPIEPDPPIPSAARVKDGWDGHVGLECASMWNE
jgi:hypothetical protein